MSTAKTSSGIIVGAGIGGIAAAIHLARGGMHVTVLEKNSHPGGRCDRYTRDGHCFDTGPTLLVMPLLYESEFAALGASAREMLNLQRVDPTYHLVFDDGSKLALTSDLEAMHRALEVIEPGSFQGLLRYLQEGNRHYNLAMARLVDRDFRHASEFFSLSNVPLLLDLKPLAKHYDHMGAFFRNPRLKAAFTFQDVYMGLSPFEAPATFSMMPYCELAHGVWYPAGGMYQVVEALMELARRAGVEFAFETEVERIVIERGRAQGVALEDGRRLKADTVIANADLPYVYEHLLPDRDLAARMTSKRFSCSVISFFWGVDRTYTALPPHTLFLADDYRENFEAINGEHTIPGNPSLYVHAPARLDPRMAPEGQDTITAIVPVGHLPPSGEDDPQAMREQAREHVFRRLEMIGITDLREHIKFEMCYTPRSWQRRYNLVKGATHGLAHTLMQLGYMRPRNQHSRYPNLYFVGASTHPGTGVPTALISGRHAATRVMDDLEIRR